MEICQVVCSQLKLGKVGRYSKKLCPVIPQTLMAADPQALSEVISGVRGFSATGTLRPIATDVVLRMEGTYKYLTYFTLYLTVP